MSVLIVPEFVEAAAEQLAGLRSTLVDVSSAAVGATAEVAPAAADEVSAAIARLFGTFGSDYQAASAQAAAYHQEFVNALTRGATSYAAAEALNVSALFNLGQLATNIEIGLGNLAAGLNGALNASLGGFGLSLGGSGSLGLNAANAFRAFAALPSLGAGLALQTGGALASGFGAGLAQTGQIITNLGVGLGGAGASISALGAGLTGEANAALAAFLSGTLGANISANLTANFTGALPSLAALAQTGGALIGNISAALSGGLPALNAAFNSGINAILNLGANLTLPALPGFPGFAFPGLDLDFGLPGITIPGIPGLSLPNFGAALTGGLNTLVNLAGNLTLPALPGFPGFTFPGLDLDFGLPGITIPGIPGLSLPNFGAALTGGLNTLVNLAGNLTLPALPGFPGFTFPGLDLDFGLPGITIPGIPGLSLPNFGAALTGGLNTLVNLAGNLTLPALPSFPGFTFPGLDLDFGLPGITIPGIPGLSLPNFGAALTGGLNTLVNLAGNLTLPALPSFPGFTFPGLDLDFGLPGITIPGIPGLSLPNFGAALTGGLNTLVNLAGNLTLPALPGFPGFTFPGLDLDFGLPGITIPGIPGLSLPNFGAALTGGLNTLVNLAGNLTLPALPSFPGFTFPGLDLDFGLPGITIPGIPGLSLPNFGAALTGGLNTLVNLAGNLTLPALPSFPGFTFPGLDLDFGLPGITIPGIPGLSLPNFGAALTGGLNTLVNLAGNLTLPALPGFPGFTFPGLDLDFGLPGITIPGIPGLSLPNFGAALTGGLNTLVNLAGNLTLPALPSFPGFTFPGLDLDFGLPGITIPGIPGLSLPNFGAALTGGLNTLVNLAGNLTLPALPGFPGFTFPGLDLDFGLPGITIPGIPGLSLPNFGAALTGGLNTLVNLAGNLTLPALPGFPGFTFPGLDLDFGLPGITIPGIPGLSLPNFGAALTGGLNTLVNLAGNLTLPALPGFPGFTFPGLDLDFGLPGITIPGIPGLSLPNFGAALTGGLNTLVNLAGNLTLPALPGFPGFTFPGLDLDFGLPGITIPGIPGLSLPNFGAALTGGLNTLVNLAGNLTLPALPGFPGFTFPGLDLDFGLPGITIPGIPGLSLPNFGAALTGGLNTLVNLAGNLTLPALPGFPGFTFPGLDLDFGLPGITIPGIPGLSLPNFGAALTGGLNTLVNLAGNLTLPALPGFPGFTFPGLDLDFGLPGITIPGIPGLSLPNFGAALTGGLNTLVNLAGNLTLPALPSFPGFTFPGLDLDFGLPGITIPGIPGLSLPNFGAALTGGLNTLVNLAGNLTLPALPSFPGFTFPGLDLDFGLPGITIPGIPGLSLPNFGAALTGGLNTLVNLAGNLTLPALPGFPGFTFPGLDLDFGLPGITIPGIPGLSLPNFGAALTGGLNTLVNLAGNLTLPALPSFPGFTFPGLDLDFGLPGITIPGIPGLSLPNFGAALTGGLNTLVNLAGNLTLPALPSFPGFTFPGLDLDFGLPGITIPGIPGLSLPNFGAALTGGLNTLVNLAGNLTLPALPSFPGFTFPGLDLDFGLPGITIPGIPGLSLPNFGAALTGGLNTLVNLAGNLTLPALPGFPGFTFPGLDLDFGLPGITIPGIPGLSLPNFGAALTGGLNTLVNLAGNLTLPALPGFPGFTFPGLDLDFGLPGITIPGIPGLSLPNFGAALTGGLNTLVNLAGNLTLPALPGFPGFTFPGLDLDFGLPGITIPGIPGLSLPNFGAALTGGLNTLVNLAGNLTLPALPSFPGFTFPGLDLDFGLPGITIPGIPGLSLPNFGAALTGGLNTLVNLAGNLTLPALPGFPGFTFPGLDLDFGLPGITIPGIPGLSLPNFGAALTGGLNTLVNLAGNLTLPALPGFPGFTFPGLDLDFGLPGITIPGIPGLSLPNFGAALTGGLNTLVNLAGNLTLPALPGFPGFTFPGLDLDFGLPGITIPGIPGLSLPNFGAALTGGLNTLVNLAGNLTLPALPGFPGFTFPPFDFDFTLPTFNFPALPMLSASLNVSAQVAANLGAALSGAFNAGLEGVVNSGQVLAASLSAGLTGLTQTGANLTANLLGALSGSTGTGFALADIWLDAANEVASVFGGALNSSINAGLAGFGQTGGALTAGLQGALNGLTQTGGAFLGSLDDVALSLALAGNAALTNLQLALQAAINASFGLNVG